MKKILFGNVLGELSGVLQEDQYDIYLSKSKPLGEISQTIQRKRDMGRRQRAKEIMSGQQEENSRFREEA